MRKVKVLAFVLAALMVVAAFAGCGTKQLKTDVTTLDERVTALENLLKQVNDTVNGGATKDDINELLEAITANKAEAAAGDKALADAIAKITADQTAANDKLKTDLEKLVNDAKSAQTAGDAALQVAIEKLNNSLADTNKALADSVADLLDEIKDGDEDLADALADTNKALADAIASINKAQDEQGKDVADALAATNKALEDAIKTLQDSIKTGDDAVRAELIAAIEALTQKQEEQNSAIADALAKLEETIAKNQEQAGANADLQAAINAYVGNLTVLKSAYDADKEHYVATDFVAVSNAIALGMQNINAATTVELAKTAYDTAIATLAKYERVDVALYNAIKVLENKVDDKSEDAVEALEKQLDDAQDHYADTTVTTALTKYLGDKNVNLESEVALIREAYDEVDTILEDIKQLNKDVKAIDAVRLHAVKNLGSNNTVKTYAANAAQVNANKAELTRLEKLVESTKKTEIGKYLSDALLNKVEKRAAITEQAELVVALTVAKAQLATYGEINTSGSFDKIFADYDETENDVAWFNQVDVYADIDERIAEWLDDYPEVDAANAEAIINVVEGASDLDFYDTYVANRALMNLYADAYDEFVTDLVPGIKELSAMKKVTTANVQAWGDLYNAIEAWKIVVADDESTSADEEIKIEPDQYEEMCKAALGRKTDFNFTVAEVKAFFETTIAGARLVADDIAATVDSLEKADKKAPMLDVELLKELEGYEADPTTGIFALHETKYKQTDLVDETTITLKKTAGTYTFEMFNDAYVGVKGSKYDYDLTFLVSATKAKYDALLNKINARINEAKAITDDVNAKYEKIMKAVKDVAKVSLKYEAEVNALEKDYADLTNLGFKPATTKSWNEILKADKTGTGTYTNDVLLEDTVYYQVTFLISTVNKLRAMSDAIVDYTEALVTMNGKSGNGITVKNASDKLDQDKAFIPVYTTSVDKCDGKNNDTHYHGIKANIASLAFSFVDVKDGGNSWLVAVEDAYEAYNQFMVDNNKDNTKKSNKDAALEDAMKTLETMKFIAIKNMAYVAIYGIKGDESTFSWNNPTSDFAKQKDLSLAAIEIAADLDTVAYILEGFYEMTSVAYTAIDFAGAHIFTTTGALVR